MPRKKKVEPVHLCIEFKEGFFAFCDEDRPPSETDVRMGQGETELAKLRKAEADGTLCKVCRRVAHFHHLGYEMGMKQTVGGLMSAVVSAIEDTKKEREGNTLIKSVFNH